MNDLTDLTDLTDLVIGMVALNGGQLVSKIRLQKTFYLLERCGLSSGLEFDYRYYGPFSAELARASDDAVAARRMHAQEQLGFHEVPYTVYNTPEEASEQIGELSAERAQKLLKIMSDNSAVVLELAATIVYFRERGYGDRTRAELKARKPLKATDDRIGKAQELLRRLGLRTEAPAPS